MENDQNLEENYPQYIPEGNNTTKRLQDWMELGNEIPAGLFYHEPGTGLIHINSKLLVYLKQEQVPINPVLEEYFWTRLESIAVDPDQARSIIKEARSLLEKNRSVEIRFSIGNDHNLLIKLFGFNLEGADEQTYGGIVIDLIDDRAIFQRQVKMLEEMNVQARKNNASAKGSLDALADNLHVWSQDILDDFLTDAAGQMEQVNQFLDLSLNLIQAFEALPVFSDSVNVIELIREVISEEDQTDYKLVESQEIKSSPPLSFLDPALMRLSLKYLLTEVYSSNSEGQPVELSLSIDDKDLVLKLESPRTLPLPGLSPEQEENRGTEPNIRIYLAEKIINAQGGSITTINKEPGSEVISSIEIRLPSVDSPIIPQKTGNPDKIQHKYEGRILLAEAQSVYQIQLRDALQAVGYRVDLAGDGSTALDMAQAINPALVIVARNLPGLDGLLVVQGIRRWSAIPIIMISERTDPGDLLYAYQLGVDDYLRKPVSTAELLARAQVCLRRSADASQSLVPEIYQSNLIRIDYSMRQVWIRGKPVSLTPIEYNLLVFMSKQGKQIMPYEQLLESVWEGPEKGTRQGLFVHVKRLREKIETDPKNPQIIINKWGVGYVFNP